MIIWFLGKYISENQQNLKIGIYISVFKLTQKKSLVSVGNLNVSLFLAGKIKLNFHYKKMTEKIYDNLHKNIKIVFFRF